MKIKPGVDLTNASPELAIAIGVVESVFQRHGCEATLTCVARKGTWAGALLHGILRPLGVRAARSGKVDAADFSYPPAGKAKEIVADLMERLSKRQGGQFDVLDERDSSAAAAAGVADLWTGAHLHIEFDP